MYRLNPTPRNKILCTKAALKQAILAAVEEAHEIGFLAGQKEQYAYITRPGSPDRPAWMDSRGPVQWRLPRPNHRAASIRAHRDIRDRRRPGRDRGEGARDDGGVAQHGVTARITAGSVAKTDSRLSMTGRRFQMRTFGVHAIGIRPIRFSSFQPLWTACLRS
jgi:hypothetical protein